MQMIKSALREWIKPVSESQSVSLKGTHDSRDVGMTDQKIK
jgi:hypothetical protein